MQLTTAHAEAYLRANPTRTWLTAQDMLTQPSLRHRLASFVYAGPNIMEHHRREVTLGGMAGGMQMLLSMHSAGAAKFQAGAWLRTARENRALGYGNQAIALEKAAMWRREAMNRTEHLEAA